MIYVVYFSNRKSIRPHNPVPCNFLWLKVVSWIIFLFYCVSHKSFKFEKIFCSGKIYAYSLVYRNIASQDFVRYNREFVDMKNQFIRVYKFVNNNRRRYGLTFEISSKSCAEDKKVAATWRATHHSLEFLGEMVPVASGWGHLWWGLRFGSWVDTGWLRSPSKGALRDKRIPCLSFSYSMTIELRDSSWQINLSFKSVLLIHCLLKEMSIKDTLQRWFVTFINYLFPKGTSLKKMLLCKKRWVFVKKKRCHLTSELNLWS